MRELCDAATREVRAVELPPEMPALVRDVLNAQRASGSESMLAAGLIELDIGSSVRGRLLLVWLGDCRLRVWHGTAEQTAALGIRPDTSQRWSTLVGPIGGEVHHALAVFDNLAEPLTVLAYTDGLTDLDGLTLLETESILPELMDTAMETGRDDDASLLRVTVIPHHH